MMEFEFEEKNGIIYITRYKGTQNAVVIPYEIDGIYRKVVIAADAFKDCNIKEITIHDGFRLRDIDFLDFCDDLERINVNHYGVRDYTPYKDIDGVLYTDEWQRWSPDSSPGWSPESLKWLTGGDRTSLQRGLTLVWFPQGRRGSYAIPEGVVDVRRFAAGTKCPSLSEITIPASLEDIDAILVYCDNLERINVASENPKYKDIDGVLFRKDGKRLVLFPWQSETNSYIVPDGEDLAVEEAVGGAPEDPIVEVDSEDLVVEKIFCPCELSPPHKYKDIDGVLFRKDGKRLVLFPWQSETNSYIVPDGEDLAVEEAVEGAPEDPIVEVDSEDLAVEEAVEVDSEGLVVEKGAPEEF